MKIDDSKQGPARGENSVVMQITTNQKLVMALDRAVESGYFGNSRAAAAERLLAEALRNLIKDKTIGTR